MKSIKFSVTERGTFKRCRQQWDFASYSRQSLTPLVPSRALQAGTIHHKVMDNWCQAILRNDASFDPINDVDDVSAQIIKSIADKYKAAVGMKMSRVEMEPIFEAVEFERSMVANYLSYWGSPIQEGFTLVQPEQTIVTPVCEAPCSICGGSGVIAHVYGVDKDRNCTACGGEGLVLLELEGTLDAVCKKDDVYYVVERKTYDKRPNLDYLRFFDQGTAYVLMLTQLGLGEVAGIAYDGSWRRHQPPKNSSFDDLFLRTLLLRTPYEIERLKQQLVVELRDMNNAEIYPNRRWEGCYECGYRKLCDAMTLGEDTDQIRERYYTQRDRTPAFEV